MPTLMAIVVLVASNRVWPSGGALATWEAPMLVPAPGRFSITNGLPSRCSSRRPSSRAMASVPPPAA